MEITIHKVYGSENESLDKVTGELFEYAGYQFCLCVIDSRYTAIELSTGYKANTLCIDPPNLQALKDSFSYKTKQEYRKYISQAKKSLKQMGFKLPINKKIIVDEN